MKKAMIVLSALFALISCNKENAQPESTPSVFNITINREDGTKGVKSGWENGDVVYVFVSTVAAPNYVKFTYDGSEWSNAKVGTFDITANGTMTAIYLPHGNDAVVAADGTSFKFDKTFTSYFLKAEKAAYTVSGTTVSGTLNMVAPEGFVQFSMPMTGIINEVETTFFSSTCTYTLSDSNLKPVSFASAAADGSITVTEGTEGDAITGYIYNGDINFSGVLKSAANGKDADYAFRFVSNNGTVETNDDETYILSGNKTFSYRSAIKFPTIDNSAWKPIFAFSVSDTQKVKFSPGNLQAVFTAPGTSFTWKFADNQWDYVGANAANNAISSNGRVSTAGAVDLFGWSTSYTKYGINNSTTNSTYRGDFVSWGSDADLISTLGSNWRTLTSDEWTYLVDTRDGVRYCKATVNDVPGMVIFPDGYTHPSEVTAPQNVNTADATYTSNSWSDAAWTKMERAYCVFLPAAGYRTGVNFSNVGSTGGYWSSTQNGTQSAFRMNFENNLVRPAYTDGRRNGRSVRLVQDLKY